jgi:subtilisin family serine protease
MAQADHKPRSFFLNEQHELMRGEKEGGGGIPKYAPIDWKKKGDRIQSTLRQAREKILTLTDPTRDSHYFLVAKPQIKLKKISEDRRKAPEGEIEETTDYSGKDSRVFSRLGMDLLSVWKDGSAVVHSTPERVEQLESSAASLDNFGIREKVRWATIDSFDLVPIEFLIDKEWLDSLPRGKLTESVIELQPLLTRVEIDMVMRTIASTVQVSGTKGQAIKGSGADFSGRQWLRGDLSPEALQLIATSFVSVQSLHSPLISHVTSISDHLSTPSVSISLPTDPASLPTVAIVDTGIPQNHVVLGPLRRPGGYTTPLNAGGVGTHASFVASRVVFGDLRPTPESTSIVAGLRILDVNVALGPTQIDDKELLPALTAVVATSPDIRVFNLSFDSEPLSLLQAVKHRERLILAQDLDNFIFQNDVLVVVAAGNSFPGIIPNAAYPNHYSDPNWQLGAFACSFNSLTCGSYVDQLSALGLVKQIGWPSPFCRVGPGLADSPKPDFSASGGNFTLNYSAAQGLGVWGVDETGGWQERCGTSFAAPLLARESAFVFRSLDDVCEPGTRPFAATVKAFLAATANEPVQDLPVKPLVKRTLGYGTATAERLSAPLPETAVLVWQGVLEDKDDVARIQIPIPRDWLDDASAPKIRVTIAADIPVNSAVSQIWASRKITCRLRPRAGERALTGKRAAVGPYPLIAREYDLSGADTKKLDTDLWVLELSYEEVADYLPSMAFPSQQRVAFAAELFDADSYQSSPQPFLQAMTFTKTMTRLSVIPTTTRVPVILRYQR